MHAFASATDMNMAAEAPPPPTTNAEAWTEGGGRPEFLVRGTLRYYHYGVDGFNDRGWGCGYRTVQSILSWLSPKAPIPSIPQMQALLGLSGQPWIGTAECVRLIDELHGGLVEVLALPSGADVVNHFDRLASHFERGGGPVMIGGTNDVYSKTCIGVRRCKDGQGVDLLILDPHYEGSAALQSDVATLRAGGWANWKSSAETLSAHSAYNMALPRPTDPADPPKMAPVGNRIPPAASPGLSFSNGNWDIEIVDEGCDS